MKMIALRDEPIETLYRMHAPKLLNYLVRLNLGDRRQAEDVLQETLLRAWQLMRDQPTEPAQLGAWLYTVARRIVIDQVRARKARPEESTATDILAQRADDDAIDRLVTHTTMRQALMLLRPEHRVVLIDLYFAGLTPKETAQRLGIPLGTVKSRTFYALRAMRSTLDHAEGSGTMRPRIGRQ
jgi:RNA polymerase sigma-70 factor, ECF subfamily